MSGDNNISRRMIQNGDGLRKLSSASSCSSREWDYPYPANVNSSGYHHHKIPAIHQGIAASSIPLPLDAVIQKWDASVPKLRQYLPSEIEIVYHRRTGEVETYRASDIRNHNHLHHSESEDVEHPEEKGPSPSSSPKKDNVSSSVVPNSNSVPRTGVPLDTGGTRNIPESITSSSEDVRNKDAVAINHVNHLRTVEEDKFRPDPEDARNKEIPASVPLIISKPVPIPKFDAGCQTVPIPFSSPRQTREFYCQTEMEVKCSYQDAGTQTRSSISLQSSIGSQTILPPRPVSVLVQTETDAITLLAKECENRSSQTEEEEKDKASAKPSSHLTSISTQTLIVSCTQQVQTDLKPLTKDETTQIQILLPTTEHFGCQTDTEIEIVETPKICLDCDFKQLQMEEMQEALDEMRDQLKNKEVELKMKSKQDSEKKDASINTDYDNTQDQEIKLLREENEQLKRTVEVMSSQLTSFQQGLTRLRAAIDRPIPSEESAININQVLETADSFIANASASHSRAKKINEHLSVLNSCVTLANGLLKDDG